MSSDVREIFGRYWRTYGGCRALLKSPYLHVAILLLIFTFNFWFNERWWDQSISVLPNMLGFSLGGFAMFLGFGDEKFRTLLSKTTNKDATSAYSSLCASFVHFIFIQFLALTCAILALSFDFYLPWPREYRWLIDTGFSIFGGFGYLLFLYSLTSMLAATMAVFRISYWYEQHQKSIVTNNHPRGQ